MSPRSTPPSSQPLRWSSSCCTRSKDDGHAAAKNRAVTDVPASAAGIVALGFLLGLRHALDADHVAAVSTLVSARPGVRTSAAVGALWGLGHTSALVATALAVIGLHTSIPPSVGRALELGVALMLIGLGTNALVALARGSTLHV